MRNLQFHEAAAIFPLMEDTRFDALVEDIREHGQQEPIELFDGLVLDGRNRYKACLLAGVDPDCVEIDLGDMTPAQYVVSRNLHRRHLNESQRTMVAARIKDYYAKEAKERQKRKPKDSVPENLPEQKGDARDQAGEALGVSGRSVDYASKVIANGSSDLQKAVDRGEVKVSTAAKLADLPKAEQNKALRGGKDEVRQATKPPAPQRPQLEAVDRWVRESCGVLTTVVNDYGDLGKLANKEKWPDDRRLMLHQTLASLADDIRKCASDLKKATAQKGARV